MSSHADTIRRYLSDEFDDYSDAFAALDAWEAENQQLREALRNAGKLAADILAHEGHDDILVCMEESLASARAIQHYATRAAVVEE